MLRYFWPTLYTVDQRLYNSVFDRLPSCVTILFHNPGNDSNFGKEEAFYSVCWMEAGLLAKSHKTVTTRAATAATQLQYNVKTKL